MKYVTIKFEITTSTSGITVRYLSGPINEYLTKFPGGWNGSSISLNNNSFIADNNHDGSNNYFVMKKEKQKYVAVACTLEAYDGQFNINTPISWYTLRAYSRNATENSIFKYRASDSSDTALNDYTGYCFYMCKPGYWSSTNTYYCVYPSYGNTVSPGHIWCFDADLGYITSLNSPKAGTNIYPWNGKKIYTFHIVSTEDNSSPISLYKLAEYEAIGGGCYPSGYPLMHVPIATMKEICKDPNAPVAHNIAKSFVGHNRGGFTGTKVDELITSQSYVSNNMNYSDLAWISLNYVKLHPEIHTNLPLLSELYSNPSKYRKLYDSELKSELYTTGTKFNLECIVRYTGNNRIDLDTIWSNPLSYTKYSVVSYVSYYTGRREFVYDNDDKAKHPNSYPDYQYPESSGIGSEYKSKPTLNFIKENDYYGLELVAEIYPTLYGEKIQYTDILGKTGAKPSVSTSYRIPNTATPNIVELRKDNSGFAYLYIKARTGYPKKSNESLSDYKARISEIFYSPYSLRDQDSVYSSSYFYIGDNMSENNDRWNVYRSVLTGETCARFYANLPIGTLNSGKSMESEYSNTGKYIDQYKKTGDDNYKAAMEAISSIKII